jgi:hypothetical protein
LYSRKIIQSRRKQQQKQETPIPTRIKEITGQQQHPILKLQPLFIDPPVEDKN